LDTRGCFGFRASNLAFSFLNRGREGFLLFRREGSFRGFFIHGHEKSHRLRTKWLQQ